MNSSCPPIIIALLLLVSCSQAGTPDPLPPTVFLPGECLRSAELISHMSDKEGEQLVYSGLYHFSLALDISYTVVQNNYDTHTIHPREIPADDCYQPFGERVNSVKQAYEEDFHRIASHNEGYINIVTVLYNGGLSLVADKDFAGHRAGEELAPFIVQQVGTASGHDRPEECLNLPLYSRNSAKEFLSIPLDYGCVLGKNIVFDIPVSGFKLKEERINFELSIPVKTVMYLHWIDAKLTDSDAPVPYQEDTLHCSFHTWWNMK